MTVALCPPIRLLVVDDHSLFRRGLVALLAQDGRFDVVAESGDATEALQSAQLLQPDLVLLDNHMPGVRGVDAVAGLKQVVPGVRVLMLTISENVDDIAAGLRNGADGYLLKTIDAATLCDDIYKVWEGDAVVSPELMGKLVGLLRDAAPALPRVAPVAVAPPTTDADDPIHQLSAREREILLLVAQGDSNKQIARALDIAETTVKIHVQHILRKLGLGNRVHAAVYALGRGMGRSGF
jgi:two-component system, NarL family, nitrate/nitrite response regulator NarL